MDHNTNGLLTEMIQVLREELQECGEMLARLDDWEAVPGILVDGELASAISLREQEMVIQKVLLRHRAVQRELALHLGILENAAFSEIIPCLPQEYRPLVRALADETESSGAAADRRMATLRNRLGAAMVRSENSVRQMQEYRILH